MRRKKNKKVIASTAAIYNGKIYFYDANRNGMYYASLDDCKLTYYMDISGEDLSKLATIDAYIRAYRNNDEEIILYKGEMRNGRGQIYNRHDNESDSDVTGESDSGNTDRENT